MILKVFDVLYIRRLKFFFFYQTIKSTLPNAINLRFNLRYLFCDINQPKYKFDKK